MKTGPKTVEEARALPEVSNALYEEERITDSRGHTEIRVKFRKLTARPIEGDDIILFVDADGRAMQVVDTENGPAKTPFRI